MNMSNRIITGFRRAVGIGMAAVMGAVAIDAGAASISEPHTVFYGKVLGTGSAQPFPIQEGELKWTILRHDGVEVKLRTTLYAYHNNEFSYRLDVPHSAFALGLDTDPGGVPLPPLPRTHVHALVQVDGQPATLLGPAGSTFTTEQLLRTATYRLDLGLDREAVDTDGDGIPDWWEDLHGLDKQDPNDAGIDFSGDGLTALDAYLRGLDPHRDHRAPALVTDELVVYAAGTTALMFDTADLDSSADELVYTLTQLPHGGLLRLRHAVEDIEGPDAELGVGDTFTQADVLRGRLVFDLHPDASDPGVIGLSVSDENPDHPADEGIVRLLAYQPAEFLPPVVSEQEALRLDNHHYASHGYVIADASHLPADTAVANPSAGLSGAALADYLDTYGSDRPYVFVGGAGATTLTGGHMNDVLTASAVGGTLTGGAGADWFVFRAFDAGAAVITDFEIDDQDVIDFSRLPSAAGAFVHQYIRLASVEGVQTLQVALSGTGTGFTNLSVSLPTLDAADADLYSLIESGHLLVGGLLLEPQITIAATEPRAAQSGPTPGRFTLMRQGGLQDDLLVNVTLTGTAINGTDYVTIPTAVMMPAGQTSVDVEVMPYVTGHQGVEKVVNMALATGDGYRLGAQQSALVSIQNLIMVVELEVLTGLAVQDSEEPAVVRLRRRHVTGNDALIRLSYGGTAARGTDYESAGTPLFVSMNPGQTQVLLTITPRAAAQLAAGAKTAQITILADEDYLIKPGAGSAKVALIARNDTLAAWQERTFGASGGTAEFAGADTGAYGITHLQRYAFGLDPHDPSRDGLPQPFLHDGRLAVSFRRPLSVTDVEYRVLAATDLMDWSGTTLPMVPMAVPAGVTDPERVFYIVDEEATGATHAFTIIEVEWMP